MIIAATRSMGGFLVRFQKMKSTGAPWLYTIAAALVLAGSSCSTGGALLQRAIAGFARSDTPYLVNTGNKYFAITDLAGLGSLDNGFDDTFDCIV